jgi:glutamine amidotransferase
MITIVDYGVGNICAFQNVYKRLNIATRVAKSVHDLKDVSKLILPGVGSFDFAMDQLNASGMREKLDDLVMVEKLPVIGICVGMQMMGNYSEEGNREGLKWIDSEILRFDEKLINHRVKLPHMGWNDVTPINNHRLFYKLEQEAIFYFLHSYYIKCNNREESIAFSNYGLTFSAAVNKNNIYGVQFHPEKSHIYGEQLLLNFAKL